MRSDGRKPAELRPVRILPDFLKHPLGSVLLEMGDTRVICAASVVNQIPPFLQDSGKGWVTAEYCMLPYATSPRKPREVSRGRPEGRTQEIQRLIGRALRAAVDLRQIGERTIWIDCDVIQADGGTRTASITGGYVALAMAIDRLRTDGEITGDPLLGSIAAVSVGIIDGEPVLDLNYEEDSRAEVDLNVVMQQEDLLVEVQGTAEGKPFDFEQMDILLKLAQQGVCQLRATQLQLLSAMMQMG